MAPWDDRRAPAGVTLRAATPGGDERVLTAEALALLAALTTRFQPRLDTLLAARRDRRAAWAAGEPLDFAAETREIRDAAWRVSPAPPDLTRRVVEITGPVDRKMIINGLNSGADAFMADFEDSCAPTWENVVGGQRHLMDAVRGTIEHTDATTGKHYRLGEQRATLLVRPRGLHLVERHCLVAGRPVPASLFDVTLFLFHNARELVARGSGPYLYLPKIEHHSEARFWNDVLEAIQAALGLPMGTVRATVLIETLPAAFQMDEILHALGPHAAGLNCGRWDYIFSFIKVRRHEPGAVLPDRAQVTMEQPCMRAYTQLVVRTCHRRGCHAIGGMAAQIPIKDDPEANARALARVRADKLREVRDGHDGTWVAHPGLVEIARETFAERMTGPHQIANLREDVQTTTADLLAVPRGTRTEAGLRQNLRVGVRYLEAWLGGNGCVPIDHLMEDAATAEISRSQIWQWLRHGAGLDDGRRVTKELVARVLESETQRLAEEVGPTAFARGHFAVAAELFASMCFAEELEEFLTAKAYALLITAADSAA
jgi:malate synthase